MVSPLNGPVIIEQVIATLLAAGIVAFAAWLSRRFRSWLVHRWREVTIAALAVSLGIALFRIIPPPPPPPPSPTAVAGGVAGGRLPSTPNPTGSLFDIATSTSVDSTENSTDIATSTSPTITSTSNALDMNIDASWTEIYAEDFTNANAAKSRGWDTGVITNELSMTNYRFEEKFRWELESLTDTLLYWREPIAFDSADRFSLEVEAQQVSESDFSYGLIFRYTINTDNALSYYYFAIDESRKQYAFFFIEKVKLTELIPWSNSPHIKTDARNIVKVIADGSRFTFYINGKLVNTKEDTRLASGIVGLKAASYSKGSAIVEFDNFMLREP
jgi:hypothetical protein